jgi:hypothetical protein
MKETWILQPYAATQPLSMVVVGNVNVAVVVRLNPPHLLPVSGLEEEEGAGRLLFRKR